MNLPFNIVNAVRAAYLFLIAERNYLLRLAVAPVLIKLVCYVTALALGYEDNLLRMALILVPASLIEGWMLAHVIRLITLGQRWPFQVTGDDEADIAVLQKRMHGVMGGLVSYALINILLAGLLAAMTMFAPVAPVDGAQPSAGDAGRAVMMLFAMGGLLWAFPLLWVYIPLSTSSDARAWLKDIRGMRFSLPMIGVWLLSYLPVAAVTMLGVNAILSPFPEGSVPAGARFAAIILSVVLDTLKALIGTAAMTFALGDYHARKGPRA